MNIQFTDEYDSVEDIAESVIEGCAEAQDVSKEELEIIPITAIDEAEMPLAIEGPTSEVSQREWDLLRARIKDEVMSRGYTVS